MSVAEKDAVYDGRPEYREDQPRDPKEGTWTDDPASTSGGGAATEAFETISKADYDAAWDERFDATVDDDDFAGLSDYVRGKAGPMNNALRGERDVTPTLATSIAQLDRYFDKHSSTANKQIQVKRGIYNTPTFDPAEAFKEGEVFVEPGWMSTTIDSDIADQFSGGWQYIVDVPRATKYVHGAQHQSELILPRNSRFRVKSVDKDTQRVHMVLET